MSGAGAEAAEVDPRSISAASGAPGVEELFRQEGRSLVRLARIFTEDRNAAEDLVQEAFIRFHRSSHRIRDPEAAPAYLRSIVLNLCRDHNRRGLLSRRHHAASPADPPPVALDSEVVDRDTARRQAQEVVMALQALPRRQRDCLVLRYHLELSEREIARTLGISRNTVKTHVRRGMATLTDRMGGVGDGR